MKNVLSRLLTPTETRKLLAERFKTLRLLAGYKRLTLASLSGVSVASLKRFETSGQVSLDNLLHMVHALGRLEEFADLFMEARAETMEQLREGAKKQIPKRGKI